MTGHRLRIPDPRICWLVLVTFCWLAAVPPEVHAALFQSRLADGAEMSTRAEQMETIRGALESEVLSQRLLDLGFSPEEVMAKLPTLSDEQIHQLAGLSKDVAAGGVLEAVIAVLLIILLVVVILKISDKSIVIK